MQSHELAMRPEFTTYDDAKKYVVIASLGEYVDEHDIDAIADAVIGRFRSAQNGVFFACKVGEAEFWDIVSENAYEVVE